MLEAVFVGVVLAGALGAVLLKHVDKILDINVTSWSLRKQGVADDEIHKIVIASAKRERRNVVLQVLDRIIELVKSWKQ